MKTRKSTRLNLCAGAFLGAFLACSASAQPSDPTFDPLDCGVFHDHSAGVFHLHLQPDYSSCIASFAEFNLAVGESMYFLDEANNPMSAGDRVLNRVVGGGDTVISGQLISQGGLVYLANPHGITFTSTAIVKMGAGGIFAVGGSIENDNFFNANDTFNNLTGTVENHSVDFTGNVVHLLGQHVRNYGTIQIEPGGVLINTDFVAPQSHDDPAEPRRFPVDVHRDCLNRIGYVEFRCVRREGELACMSARRGGGIAAS